MSCSCGDTFSSELGTAFNTSKNRVFHILKWKSVPRGTNGGISLIGTLAAALGGFLIGFSYYSCLKISLWIKEIFEIGRFESEIHWPILLIGLLSGILGSLIDSLLGAYFQYSGFNFKTKQIQNEPGPEVEHISGYNLLSNNQVNFFSCLIIAIAGPFFSLKLYKILS